MISILLANLLAKPLARRHRRRGRRAQWCAATHSAHATTLIGTSTQNLEGVIELFFRRGSRNLVAGPRRLLLDSVVLTDETRPSPDVPGALHPETLAIRAGRSGNGNALAPAPAR